MPATVHRVATASKRAGDRSYLALLLALSALVMGTLAVLHDRYVLLAGDEPNYLIISQALQLYHSIDVQRVYDAANYHAFYHSRRTSRTVRMGSRSPGTGSAVLSCGSYRSYSQAVRA